eukprot:10167974-Alexandrium_andersonii.AAC.1
MASSAGRAFCTEPQFGQYVPVLVGPGLLLLLDPLVRSIAAQRAIGSFRWVALLLGSFACDRFC